MNACSTTKTKQHIFTALSLPSRLWAARPPQHLGRLKKTCRTHWALPKHWTTKMNGLFRVPFTTMNVFFTVTGFSQSTTYTCLMFTTQKKGKHNMIKFWWMTFLSIWVGQVCQMQKGHWTMLNTYQKRSTLTTKKNTSTQQPQQVPEF